MELLTDLTALQTELSTKLAALDAASVIKVQALVAAWDNISLDTASQEDGQVGDISGLSYSPSAAQLRIMERFKIYVPIMRLWELEKLRAGKPSDSGGGTFIPRIS